MKIYANQLLANLENPASCYILVGQDPFLLEESTQAIKAYAQQQGFSDKLTFTYESANSFDWQGFTTALSSQSLFCDKQFIEWIWQTPNFNEKQLSEVLDLMPPPQSTLLLIRAGHLNKAQLNAKWFKALSKDACLVSHWPLRTSDYPRYIAQLAKKKSLTLNQQACQFLSAHYEGRLSALSQLIEKLSLSYQGTVSVEQIEQHLDKQHPFDVFALQTALISQNANQVMTILNYFKQMKMEMTLILWCLNRLMTTLYQAKANPHEVNPQWLKSKGIWSSDEGAFRRWIQIISLKKLENNLKKMTQIDMDYKTGNTQQSWQNVCIISLNLISATPHIDR